MVCLAPRALGDSVRPRRSSGVVVRPLNFTVSLQRDTLTRNSAVATLRRCGIRGTRRSVLPTSATTVSTSWMRRRYSQA